MLGAKNLFKKLIIFCLLFLNCNLFIPNNLPFKIGDSKSKVYRKIGSPFKIENKKENYHINGFAFVYNSGNLIESIEISKSTSHNYFKGYVYGIKLGNHIFEDCKHLKYVSMYEHLTSKSVNYYYNKYEIKLIAGEPLKPNDITTITIRRNSQRIPSATKFVFFAILVFLYFYSKTSGLNRFSNIQAWSENAANNPDRFDPFKYKELQARNIAFEKGKAEDVINIEKDEESDLEVDKLKKTVASVVKISILLKISGIIGLDYLNQVVLSSLFSYFPFALEFIAFVIGAIILLILINKFEIFKPVGYKTAVFFLCFSTMSMIINILEVHNLIRILFSLLIILNSIAFIYIIRPEFKNFYMSFSEE